MSRSYFHVTSAPLEAGSVILPGSYGRIVRQFGHRHGHALRESVLEHVRANEFPGLPSRLDAAFFFEDLAEALHYRDSAVERITMLVYEIELLDHLAALHRADHRAVGPSGEIGFGWATRYWAGEMLPPVSSAVACCEVLAVSRMRIVRPVA